MRYSASETGIIKLVEQSHLPAKRTLDKLGFPVRRSTSMDGPSIARGCRDLSFADPRFAE